MVILYEVHDNLYVNMTNKCPCACTFCLRQTRDEMNHSGSLWLEREPSVEEVKNEFSISIKRLSSAVSVSRPKDLTMYLKSVGL